MSGRWLKAGCLTLVLAATGCGATAGPDTHATGSSAVTSAEAGQPTSSAGRLPPIIHRGAGLSAGQKAPLLIALEGAASIPADMMYSTGFNKVADQRGFVVAYLATSDPQHAWSPRLTNDLQYVGAMIAQLVKTQNIDPRRIYVTGFSAGGYMAWSVACHYSSEIAGVAVVSNAMNKQLYNTCHLSHPVSQYLVIGTANGNLFTGIPGKLPSAAQTTARWQALNGCSGASTVGHPAPGVVVRTSDSCLDGSSVSLTVIVGGVHVWPSPANVRFAFPAVDRYDASNAIWDFLSVHRLAPTKVSGKLLSLTASRNAKGRAIAGKFRLGEPVKVTTSLSRRGRVTKYKPVSLRPGSSAKMSLRVAATLPNGRYTVKLQITDPYGRRLSYTRTVTVPKAPKP